MQLTFAAIPETDPAIEDDDALNNALHALATLERRGVQDRLPDWIIIQRRLQMLIENGGN
jgi:hypothetical protein